MEQDRINEKMNELAKKIKYPIDEHGGLILAMNAEKRLTEEKGENNNETKNDALATVGDAILREVLITHLFNLELNRGELTELLQKYENNYVQKKLCDNLGITNYAYKGELLYDELPDNDKPRTAEEHFPYLEAIIGAMYYDVGYELTRQWILNWLLPRLKNIVDNQSKADLEG